MKFLIAESSISQEELSERRKYIYDVFHIYTFVDSVSSTKDITILKSMPINEIDLLIIVGHDRSTDEYLIKNYNKLKEKNIAIIACNTKYFKSFKYLSDYNVFVPKNGGILEKHNGELYGFKFNITDEEIMLYRKRNISLEDMLNSVFERRI